MQNKFEMILYRILTALTVIVMFALVLLATRADEKRVSEFADFSDRHAVREYHVSALSRASRTDK